MTRFFDGKRILSINMIDCKSGICFEDEFFDIQKRTYDEKRCAYMAKNVYLLALRAERYANKKNPERECTVDAEIEPISSMNIEIDIDVDLDLEIDGRGK